MVEGVSMDLKSIACKAYWESYKEERITLFNLNSHDQLVISYGEEKYCKDNMMYCIDSEGNEIYWKYEDDKQLRELLKYHKCYM